MHFKWLRYYLMFMGVILNLAIMYEAYVFANLVRQLGSVPNALSTLAYRVSDIPVFNKLSPTLESAAQSLDRPSYQWKPFQREHWPMIGPDFSVQDTKFNLMSNATLYVSDSKALLEALRQVKPGETIVVAAGDYVIKSKRFNTSSEVATADSPITLLAEQPGSVNLLMQTSEGIFLHQPYWTINGFRFECTSSKCEHAVHIVGNADYTTISNNEFVNFNAALKINGYTDQNLYPDNGTIINNYFYSTSPQKTGSPVTPINIDHGDHWQVSKNIIRDFIKTRGNQISYGAFMKGGTTSGIFENNLIVCNTSKTRYSGSQVGLSIGGGGMKDRRNKAPYEANNTVIRNNIISHCNDVGIYINRGQNSLVNNNTIYNTSGIDIRFPESSATIINNIVSGKLRERDNGRLVKDEGNLVYGRGFWHNDDKLNQVFLSPEIGNFTIRDDSVDIHKTALPYPVESAAQTTDFCGQPVTDKEVYLGAFKDEKGCFVAN